MKSSELEQSFSPKSLLLVSLFELVNLGRLAKPPFPFIAPSKFQNLAPLNCLVPSLPLYSAAFSIQELRLHHQGFSFENSLHICPSPCMM